MQPSETLLQDLDQKEKDLSDKPKGRLLFLNSHPIQYFAPLYQTMSRNRNIDLTVLYCSPHGLSGELDREFGVEVKWDIPVLEGYRSIFFKNWSFRPGIYGFLGLFNPGLIRFLFRTPKSTLVVHGWGYLTHILAILTGKLAGHTVCIRGESPLSHERNRRPRAVTLRRWIFGQLLFPFADYFLFIGNENKAFYRSYGVPERKLLFTPYAVDNTRFQDSCRQLHPQKVTLRKALQLPADKTIFLFSGKYIEKKRPLDLLKAFHYCHHREKGFLVFMGEGELRREMEDFIRDNQLKNVVLTGFVNQSKVSEFYAAADVFVMCSQEGETWGLSANEAMNFNLPVLLSDLTGSSADLVMEGENGFVFETGNVEDLSDKLDRMLSLTSEEREQMGKLSGERIKRYDYRQIIHSLQKTFSA